MNSKVLRNIAITLIAFLFCISAHAQECGNIMYRQKSDTLTVYFPLNRYAFNPSYMNNQSNIEKFIELGDMKSIVCRVTSSPEGSLERNSYLSRKRAEAIAGYIHSNYDVADSQVKISVTDEAWDELEALIRVSDMPWKGAVLQIFEEYHDSESRKNALRMYANGTVWEWMKANWFPSLRQTLIIVKTSEKIELISKIEGPAIDFQLELPQPAGIKHQPTPGVRPWSPQMYIKTNILGWGMGHANIAAEVDFAPHWSVAIPFYYSGGFDYFKETLKFRGIVVQPEVRYYTRLNEGFFIGAHAGLGWYNFALDGEYRIQDHRGRRPAIGGGLGIGYKVPFKKHPHWGMEFSVGAGIYDVKYDIFYNEPNGAYAEYGIHDTFIGVDNAAISFTYRFPLKKEGRK